LKTPLSVLATTAAALEKKSDHETGKLIAELTADMSDKVDYQLRLSRLRVRTRTHVYSASINECLDKTIGVLKRRAPAKSWRGTSTSIRRSPSTSTTHDLIELLAWCWRTPRPGVTRR